MDEQISALMKIIGEEISLYRALIAHARRKTALLIRGSLEAILESKRVDETFNADLRALENELAHLSQQLCQVLHITREDFTLLKLAEGLEKSIADEIRLQTALFRKLVGQLNDIDRRNRKLLEHSLDCSRVLARVS